MFSVAWRWTMFRWSAKAVRNASWLCAVWVVSAPNAITPSPAP
jgi:hypothetical protein